MGIKEFAITSDGENFENPKWLRKCQKRLTKLAKSIADVSWSEFRRMLTYKAKWYGRELVIAPSNYASSQICSNCGNKSSQTKDLSCRTYICPVCGMIMYRDINASKNLLKLAM